MADCELLRYGCFFLFVFVQNVGADTTSCKKIDNCSCRTNDGKILNLKPVDKNPGPSFTVQQKDPKNTFSWSPCTQFTQGTDCKDTLVCQKTGTVDVPIAREVSSFDVNSDGTINITYIPVRYPPASSTASHIRRAIIKLKCDTSQARGKLDQFDEKDNPAEEVKINYTSTFTSKYACPESEGLSAGSILLIVFFPLVLVYFVTGLLYNKIHKGVNSFPEMIPNHSFWGELPFLVKDGCFFTFQGIAGCCKRTSMKFKGDSYAEI